jgi:D-glucosaminate-6-phosphate ammonia-lyase
MISRRNLLKVLPAIPVTGLFGNTKGGTVGMNEGAPARPMLPDIKSIYESVGVRPIINARGTVTILGATRTLPEVKKAMEDASKDYVQLDELMEGVAKRLAELTAAEWGIVTSGASAAITAATAACTAGGDPDKLWKVPDLTGMKDEVIIPSYSRTAYEAAARAVGVKMIEVNDAESLASAIGPQTAMVLVLAGGRASNGPLSLEEIVSIAKPRGVPVLVDAAAEDLVVPNPHLSQGADMVAYSGGKCLRGPQCAGLLLGRKDLINAAWISMAPHHGFGRGFKVGREEIMGMLAAVEMWMERDHAQEYRTWTSWAQHIADRLAGVEGVTSEVRHPKGLSNRAPSLRVEWNMTKIALTGYDAEQLLWNGDPRIAVSGAGSFLPFPPNVQPHIEIYPSQLEAGEEKIIAKEVYKILSNPPLIKKREAVPQIDIHGTWNIRMKFSAGTADQTFVIVQEGNLLRGTHRASFASRDLSGAIHGKEILIRSFYSRQGVRLHFEFSGTVEGDTMGGPVTMGEYGTAAWAAERES